MADKGRPKITTDEFPEGWEDAVIALGAEGASDVELRDYLNCIAFETWERLLNEDPHFFETIKIARSKCEVWWQKVGRTNLWTKEFSPTLWYMNMKNRFGWRDKEDINVGNQGDDSFKMVISK